ncbi:MAG: 4Fe-4S dicluster domain-containing protein [Bdellovibrio sp.]|nr:4Fe-4S dicluster domain-containing protein [Bdellovibrio sp.]
MSKKDSDLNFDQKTRDLSSFKEKIIDLYNKGKGSEDIAANELLARSLLPPLTAKERNFSAVSSMYPIYYSDKCVGCLECVVACPDAAILARVNTDAEVQDGLVKIEQVEEREFFKSKFVKTTKYWSVYERKNKTPALFSLWIDPTKCKGCEECVEICHSGAHDALKMISKTEHKMEFENKASHFVNNVLPITKDEFIDPRLYTDLFLIENAWVYQGGAGSCRGCGEMTALKMALAVTGAKYGKDMVIVAATGCNSVFSSTYPWNIFSVPWTNSLFENSPAVALGVRMRLNQTGKKSTKVWVVGGDGAMNDIGFQSLSRVLMSQEDIKILVLDTQVYSNTGGQVSCSTFMGQDAKMGAYGKVSHGKKEYRKELGLIAMAHPQIFVAQVSPAYFNHFFKTVHEALEFPGPALIIAYSPCMPEHGVSDDLSFDRAKAAVMSRAFPIFVYNPKRGNTIKENLDLKGNPSVNEDWHKDPKTGEICDFIWFAKKEGRFSKSFNKEGLPNELLKQSQEERAKNWHVLKELAQI